MPPGQHCANPLGQPAASFLQASHVGSRAQDQQAPDVLVAAPANPEERVLSTCTVLSGHKPYRCREIATAFILLAVTHLRREYAGRDRADAGDAQQTLADIVVSELARQLLVDLTDLCVKVLKVFVQTFEDRDQPRRQFVHGENSRQTRNGSLSHRQTDAVLEQEAMHLVGCPGAIAHHRFAHAMQNRRVCCDSVFAVTNLIVGRDAASQIASASTKSFLFDLTNGRTNCGEISLTMCPNVASLRAI
jgi:hypothetical protein